MFNPVKTLQEVVRFRNANSIRTIVRQLQCHFNNKITGQFGTLCKMYLLINACSCFALEPSSNSVRPNILWKKHNILS